MSAKTLVRWSKVAASSAELSNEKNDSSCAKCNLRMVWRPYSRRRSSRRSEIGWRDRAAAQRPSARARPPGSLRTLGFVHQAHDAGLTALISQFLRQGTSQPIDEVRHGDSRNAVHDGAVDQPAELAEWRIVASV